MIHTLKVFECKLVYKTNKNLIKIDFVKAQGAIQASITANQFNPDWICVSANVIE